MEPPQKRQKKRKKEHLFSQAEHILTEYIASLEHEFRTPLAIIKSATSMLLRQGQATLSPDQREALQMIQDAETRLEILANRLLELTQLETGLLSPMYTLIDLPSLVRQVLTSTQEHLPEALQDRFTFALHVRNQQDESAQEMPLVPGDRQSLRNVLQHVLDNAVQFSPQGGRIEIVLGSAPLTAVPNTLAPYLVASRCVEVCVCDYGIGIPQEHLERIFERFYRIDTSLTRQSNGLGLGLTLCRLLLGLHHGHIWAESCSAGGSAFHIWLPLEHAPSIA